MIYKVTIWREKDVRRVAESLAILESNIAKGVEENAFNAEGDNKFVGKHTLREYLEANKDIWVIISMMRSVIM